MKHALKSLPRGLDATYGRILERIIEDCSRDDAFSALQWLAYAVRPLRIEEVAETIAIRPGASSLDEDDKLFEPEAILGTCSSLVTMFRETRIIQLAHFSVKEYLISEKLRTSRLSCFGIQDVLAQTYIAESCLTYLLLFDREDSLVVTSDDVVEVTKEPDDPDTRRLNKRYPNLVKVYPLLQYAATNWFKHATEILEGSPERVKHQILTLLNPSRDCCFLNWLRVYGTCYWSFHKLRSFISTDPITELIESPPPLWWAVNLGLLHIVRRMLDDGADVNGFHAFDKAAVSALGDRGESPFGHDTTEPVREILRALSDSVNIQEACVKTGWRSPLDAAINQNNTKMALLLLSRGANVHWRYISYSRGRMSKGRIVPALTAAVRQKNQKMVGIILKAGANANGSGTGSDQPLLAACGTGRVGIVRLLLDHGADVTSVENAETVLCASVLGREKQITEMILARTADIDFGTDRYGSALYEAARVGSLDIVKLLLENGANPNALGGRHGSALQAAALWKHSDMVKLLLESGANPNGPDGRYWYGSALQAAAEIGSHNRVKLLLENEADPNAPGGRYGSALQAAAHSGSSDIVELLLENGSNPNALGGLFGSALLAAARKGHLEIVKFLLEHKADPNIRDKLGSSAVTYAAANGHLKMVTVLLEAGAEVNAQGGRLRNALRAAASHGHEEVVAILLDNGADIKSLNGHLPSTYIGGYWQCPIKSQEAIVKLLMDRGATGAALPPFEKICGRALDRP